ncbi:MAG: hypothetical protein ACFFD4_10410 [Candidatus Odinarchaeota archaeon]
MNDYELVKLLARRSDKDISKILSLIEEKLVFFKFILRFDTAIFLVAKDLNIDIQSEIKSRKSKLDERYGYSDSLYPVLLKYLRLIGIDSVVDVQVVIYNINSDQSFTVKSGKKGTYSSLDIFDVQENTSRLVFWNERSGETSKFKVGDRITVKNARIRYYKGDYELHVMKNTEITITGTTSIPKPFQKEIKTTRNAITNFYRDF